MWILQIITDILSDFLSTNNLDKYDGNLFLKQYLHDI